MKFLARIAICSILFFSIMRSTQAMGQLFMFEDPLVGKKIPDFSLKTAAGEDLNLTKFRDGQNTMVFFWATWCPHCREQLQELTSHLGAEMEKKGIKILLVDVDETPAEVHAYVKKYKVPFEIVIDANSTVAEQYNLVGVPTFFFVDKKGMVRGVDHVISENYEEFFSEKEAGKK